MAYGKYDKLQPYEGSLRLLAALEDNNIPHDYYLCEHSGHGLQNDNKVYVEYMRKMFCCLCQSLKRVLKHTLLNCSSLCHRHADD